MAANDKSLGDNTVTEGMHDHPKAPPIRTLCEHLGLLS